MLANQPKRPIVVDGKAVQTLIFPKEYYTSDQALSWAKRHGFKHYTQRETDNTIRVRQFPPRHVSRVLGVFPVGPKVKALYVKVK